MSKAKTLRKIVAGKAKRVVAEVIGDQTLDDEGRAQEQRARDEDEESGETKPFGNLDRPT
ncbi:MAG TPA: CsbD family protein [Bradyrhizobium sp.]|uniref:CsbD family protein n=1 Tax=Bradyrhizobium sp. TaxID=376 RepID=UPI002D7FB1C0|nr:CsbD family protein [Bradyrhizobium sp.]HET7884994.1 CsbD family protein [Bradyrhizobium sp.]